MFPMETHIERKRGTLRKYLEETKEEFFVEIQKTAAPAKNVNKILWWQQKYIHKMEGFTSFWEKS